MPEEWVVKPRPNPKARLRLFCFHSAGSGASMFVPWAALLPGDVELNAIQLPGRENRLKEPPYKRIEPLLSDLDEIVFPLLDRPFAVFGISMGGLIGFEFARKLRQTYGIEPVHFFTASRRAPQTPDPLPYIAHLPDTAFLEAIQARYNSIPELIWKDGELMQLFLPLLRADFSLLEAYAYQEEPQLDCPLTVMYGENDATINEEGISGWHIHTRGRFTRQRFSGGHFFPTGNSGPVVNYLVRQGLGSNGHMR